MRTVRRSREDRKSCSVPDVSMHVTDPPGGLEIEDRLQVLGRSNAVMRLTVRSTELRTSNHRASRWRWLGGTSAVRWTSGDAVGGSSSHPSIIG